MTILSKRCKQDNFEPHNSLKLSFTNIRGLCSKFVRQTIWGKLGWFYWFWQFLCQGLFSFNPKQFCYSYAWSCSLCERRTSFCTGFPFAQDLSLENSVDSYLCFWLALLHSVSYFFFLYRSPSLLLCSVFDSISSNADSLDQLIC